MGITITFNGGPTDGRIMAIHNDQPPSMYLIPIEPSVTQLFGGDLSAPLSLRAAEYEPLRENGWPSRTDDGTYRYRYRGTPEPPHPRQSRPTPTVDELAAMTCDPSPTAYPDSRSHLLACRTRHALRRDERPNSQERATMDAVTWAEIQQHRERRG